MTYYSETCLPFVLQRSGSFVIMHMHSIPNDIHNDKDNVNHLPSNKTSQRFFKQRYQRSFRSGYALGYV